MASQLASGHGRSDVAWTPGRYRASRAALLARFIALAFVLAFHPAVEGHERQSAPATPLAEFSVYSDGDALLAPVSLAGTQQLFSLDTGATCSIGDPVLVGLLGPQIRQVDASTPDGGEIQTMLHEFPRSASIQNIPFPRNTAIAVHDLEPFRRVGGHATVGAVGMDFLKHFVVEINLDRGKVRLLRNAEQRNVRSIDIRWTEDRLASVPAVVGHGHQVGFIIDTGLVDYYGTGSLSRETLSKLIATGDAVEVEQTSNTQTLAGTTRDRVWRVSSFSIGEITIRDALFSESVLDMLGLNLFIRVVATFDFPNGKLCLKPSQRVDYVDVPSTSGLHIWRVNGVVEVHSVDPGSRAAAASIEPRDILLQIGDDPAATSRLHSLRVALERNETPLSLTLRRGRQEFHTDLPSIGRRTP